MKQVKHTVVLHIIQQCDDKPMTASQVQAWVKSYFQGSDYGDVHVREVTTDIDGKETDNKLFSRKIR